MKKNLLIVTAVIGLGVLFSGFSLMYPTGAPAGYTGSPGDNAECTQCHGGTATTITGIISTNIPAAGYTPGTTYQITVTNNLTGSGKFGFELSPQKTDGTQLGTLVAGTGSKLVGGTKYITHSNANASTSSWTFGWTAPATGSGTVNFYAAIAKNKPGPVAKSSISVNEAVALPAGAGPISGPVAVCQGTSNNYSVGTISGATGYVWSVPSGASITAGQNTTSVTVSFSNTAVSGNISVYGTNGAGNGASSNLGITVNPLPSQPSEISGSASVCHNSDASFSVTNVPGTSYSWTVPAGAVITSGQGTNSINVTFGTLSGLIQVIPSNSCGNGPARSREIFVAAQPSPPDFIEGSTSPCSGTVQVYTVIQKPGESYSWLVPTGSTIQTGQGTNQISVSIGAEAGDISVIASNVCGAAEPQLLTVSPQFTPAQPGEITGQNTPCQASQQSFTVPFIAGLEYIWTVPSGYTIISGQGSNSILVSIGAATGELSVTAHNNCGTSPARARTITPSPLPLKPANIQGVHNVDLRDVITSNYSTEGAQYALQYEWSVSPENSGTIEGISANATMTWNQNFTGVALIKVRGVNDCGNGDWSQIFEVNVTKTTGVEFDKSEGLITPNPTDGTFKLNLNEQYEDVVVIISDFTGKTVLRRKLSGSKSYSLTTDLANGIYLLTITSKGRSLSTKLVINR